MNYYNIEETRTEEGVFVKHHKGYFTFRFSFEEIIIFEEIKTSVMEVYNLKSEEYLGASFEVTYKEIINDLDDDDFLTFRIIDLKLI